MTRSIMLKALGPALLLAVALPQTMALAQSTDATTREELEEVVVAGRFPGPPLWKISSGEHVLWILPLVDMYPRKMEWDSTRVEKLIAGSQEYIARPRIGSGIALSLNPASLFRALSLSRKGTLPASGKPLAEALPPELYRRFGALKSRYFPDNRSIEKMGISAAGRVMQQEILDRENLEMLKYRRIDSPQLITEKTRKWLKGNKAIRFTDASHVPTQALSSKDFKALGKIMEEMSTSPVIAEWEVACLEKAIAYFENDLEPVKRRANAWAQGHADDLVNPTPLYGGNDYCQNPPRIESAAMDKFRKDNPAAAASLAMDTAAANKIRKEKWLAAAEAALARNTSTFSVLAVNDVLDEDGLVARLQAKGYTVEISAE